MSDRKPEADAGDERAVAPTAVGQSVRVAQPGAADQAGVEPPAAAPSRSWSASREERLAIVDRM